MGWEGSLLAALTALAGVPAAAPLRARPNEKPDAAAGGLAAVGVRGVGRGALGDGVLDVTGLWAPCCSALGRKLASAAPFRARPNEKPDAALGLLLTVAVARRAGGEHAVLVRVGLLLRALILALNTARDETAYHMGKAVQSCCSWRPRRCHW